MSGRTTRSLRGTEVPVTEETYAQVAWLLRKYTSYTYCERMWQLYASFLVGYEAYGKTKPGAAESYTETFGPLHQYQARLEEGLRLLRVGDRSGYPNTNRSAPNGSSSGKTSAISTGSSRRRKPSTCRTPRAVPERCGEARSPARDAIGCAAKQLQDAR